MQDSNTNKNWVDEQFMEHAWQHMREVLDVEMPVRRKRRGGWIWLVVFGGAAAASLIFGMPNFSMENKSQTPAFEVVDENIYNEKNNVQSGENEGVINSKITTTTEGNSSLQLQPSLKNNQDKDVKTKLPSEIRAAMKQQKHRSPKFQNTPSNQKNVAEVSQNPILNLPKKEAGADDKMLVAEVFEIEKIGSVYTLLEIGKKNFIFEKIIHDVGEESENDNIANDAKNENEDSPSETAKRKFTGGLYSNLILDNATTTNLGIGAGWQMHFPIGKKLGIRTGLGVAVLPKNETYGIIQSHEAEYTGVSNSGFFGGNLIPLQSSNVSTLRRTTHLDLPVLMTFNPHPKWQIMGGASLSYLLNAKFSNQDNSVQINRTTNTYDNIQLEEVAVASLSFEKVSRQVILEKFYVSAVLGIGFQSSKRWSFQLEYHHNANNFFKNISSDSSLAGGVSLADGPELLPISSGNYGKEQHERKLKMTPRSFRFTVNYNLFR